MKDNANEPSSNIRRFSLFPRQLSKTLTQLVKPIYKKHGFAEHRILTEWHLIVGDELASVSLPQKLVMARGQKEGGTLHVLAASARALELQHMQPVILDRIATFFGYPAVARLAFTQTSSPLFRKKAEAPPAPESKSGGPFAQLAEQCGDEELRCALQSLAQTLDAVEN